MKIQRVLISSQPFASARPSQWSQTGLWPASWISPTLPTPLPAVIAYKLDLRLTESLETVIHVTADERYELFVDGELAGRGPERGDPENWFFESYQLSLEPGTHTLVACVWSLGPQAPFAQMSLGHGFLLCPDEPSLVALLGTGEAPWLAKALPGFEWQHPLSAWGTGANQIVKGAEYAWQFEAGGGENWLPVSKGMPGARHGSQYEKGAHHRLRPAMLPPQRNEFVATGVVRHAAQITGNPCLQSIRSADNLPVYQHQFQQLLEGNASVTLAAGTRLRVILDLEEYYCGRSQFEVSGGLGSRLEVDWTEALYENTENWSKGHRDQLEGKFFTPVWHPDAISGDVFFPDGQGTRIFRPLWWQAGRYQQLLIEVGDAPLTLHQWGFWETRYPLEMEATWSSSNPELDALVPMMVRGLQMCSHETYMDCPYYEQLMYVGDTRLEVLVTYAITRDEALPRKALKIFDWSRMLSGLTQSRYPCWARQIIPPFSLWWVAMCHDYALWRGDPEFTRSLLPGVRAVCDYFASLINEEGLMTAPDGWNFTDWVKTTEAQQEYYGGDPKWHHGVPPSANWGISGILNWQASLVFKQAGELESWFGEPEMAALQTRRSQSLAKAVDKAFWNEEKGLYADDLNHENWSEHAQCLAILSGHVPPAKLDALEKGLFQDTDLARTTIYFSHYLMETCRVLHRMDKFFARLQDWQELAANGLKTTIEMPEPTRSDCHAWGAHPLFHYFATIAGIRPAAPSFAAVQVDPQTESQLQWFRAELPHPNGTIKVQYSGGETKVEAPLGIKVL